LWSPPEVGTEVDPAFDVSLAAIVLGAHSVAVYLLDALDAP